MTKIRVHELSKELGIDNKDLIQYLEDHKVDVKNHMSSLSDEDADRARSAFSRKKNVQAADERDKKPAAGNTPDNNAQNKTQGSASEPVPSGEVRKKSNIIRVVRPQNAQQGMRGFRQGGTQQGRPSGQQRPSGMTRPSDRPRPSSFVRPSDRPRPSSLVRPSDQPRPSSLVRPSDQPRPSSLVRPSDQPRPSSLVRPSDQTESANQQKPSGQPKIGRAHV